jgi:4-hydroxy-2-oxoheptanedioate aldolase
MNLKTLLLTGIAGAMLAAMPVAVQAQPFGADVPVGGVSVPPPMPTQTTRTGKRINRIIDMWLKNQPVYYAQVEAGGYEEAKVGMYEMGKRMSATKADYITYEMEHGAFDFRDLRDFMRGLVDAGATRTGHRTPAVIVTLPLQGTPDVIRANGWVIQQTLAAGVHGILLCNAESAEAVRLMIEAARYPFAPRVGGLAQGTRGSGSQNFASQIWGVPANEYVRYADPWPLNPDGEMIFGVKIENPRATANVETIVRVPGVAFAEWGPGDNAFYLVGAPAGRGGGRGAAAAAGRGAPAAAPAAAGRGAPAAGRGGGGGQDTPAMLAVRTRVLNATKAAGIRFLNACGANNVEQQLRDGVMICTGGDSPAADIGRKFSGRTDPW